MLWSAPNEGGKKEMMVKLSIDWAELENNGDPLLNELWPILRQHGFALVENGFRGDFKCSERFIVVRWPKEGIELHE
jgi:hypothetical protein